MRAAGRCPVWAALALALALGAPGAPAAGLATAEAARSRLALAERYLESAAAERIEAEGDARAHALLAEARRLHRAGLEALETGDVESASERAREAVRAFSRATLALREQRTEPEADRAELERLREEILGYRRSFLAGLETRGPAAAALLDVDRLDALLAEAERGMARGERGEARARLREARAMAVQAVTRLRDNETVVYALEFRTPADEYRYEQERFRGYWLLVEQMKAAGKAEGPRATLVERYAREGAELRDRAGGEASRGDFERAIATMEEAVRSLGRALRMMGLAVPG